MLFAITSSFFCPVKAYFADAAEALEALHPKQSVFRVDGSKDMLDQHRPESQTQLWDLNLGLPSWPNQPTLIASSFALHWLNDPASRIQEWFSALTPGGWLALTLPVHGSFNEWHLAAQSTGVPCSAMNFPCHESLLKAFHPRQIRCQELHTFTQTASGIGSLLKPIVKVGGHTNFKAGLSVGDWRQLQRAWPCSSSNKKLKLTWLIQLLLVQR